MRMINVTQNIAGLGKSNTSMEVPFTCYACDYCKRLVDYWFDCHRGIINWTMEPIVVCKYCYPIARKYAKFDKNGTPMDRDYYLDMYKYSEYVENIKKRENRNGYNIN